MCSRSCKSKTWEHLNTSASGASTWATSLVIWTISVTPRPTSSRKTNDWSHSLKMSRRNTSSDWRCFVKRRALNSSNDVLVSKCPAVKRTSGRRWTNLWGSAKTRRRKSSGRKHVLTEIKTRTSWTRSDQSQEKLKRSGKSSSTSRPRKLRRSSRKIKRTKRKRKRRRKRKSLRSKHPHEFWENDSETMTTVIPIWKRTLILKMAAVKWKTPVIAPHLQAIRKLQPSPNQNRNQVAVQVVKKNTRVAEVRVARKVGEHSPKTVTPAAAAPPIKIKARKRLEQRRDPTARRVAPLEHRLLKTKPQRKRSQPSRRSLFNAVSKSLQVHPVVLARHLAQEVALAPQAALHLPVPPRKRWLAWKRQRTCLESVAKLIMRKTMENSFLVVRKQSKFKSVRLKKCRGVWGERRWKRSMLTSMKMKSGLRT